MSKSINYLSQFRLYSLMELALALYALQADVWRFVGAMLLWCGSNAVLESVHHDVGRERMPRAAAIVFNIIGLACFGVWQGLPFVLAAVIYSWKKQGRWGLVAPFIRGFQMLVLLYPLWYFWPSLAMSALLVIRNYVGDRRDVEEDRRDGIQTWPAVLGQEKDEPFSHLLFMFLTTTIWWGLSNLQWYWLAMILIFEAGTYWTIPRESNKNALAVGRKILRYIRG